MFENKKLFILGMARSGYESAKLLANKGNEILITDMSDQDLSHVTELKSLGVSFVQTNTPENLLDDTFDFVIKNPGIKINHPVCLKAKEIGIPVTNEVEVAYSFLPKDIKIIGITGSNGKTTTTTLIYKILKEAGLPALLGGNIGYPVCSLVDNAKSGDILVLEISSHQLHDIINFKTDISVLTNLSEVHIDHFETYENYTSQKARIFNRHTSKDIAIINLSNSDSIRLTQNLISSKIYFSSQKGADACINNDAIYYKNEKVIDLSKIKLKGIHNYENSMCAIIIAKELNVGNDVIEKVLSSFGGVEHRLEFVKEVNGISFYNDSKATNVKSTQIALSSFSTPVILLLGGLDRGHSFDDLEPYMKNVKHIVCFGETKNRIKEFAGKIKKECTILDTLKEVVPFAYSLAKNGDTILLSPACASWDQYKKFEDRGDEFKSLVP